MMGSFLASASFCLLLSLRAAWAALVVTVPSMEIQARPGSDVQLPCFFSDSSRSVDIKQLGVIWKKGSENIAMYRGEIKDDRPGQVISAEQLSMGNATLLLKNVQELNAGVYKCLIIHVPDSGEGTVQLRVEAPPQVSIRRRKLYLGQPSVLTCAVSDFYPSNISVMWLRDSEVLSDCRLRHTQPRLDGLFDAECTLEITPRVADAKTNFSCQVSHQALKSQLQEDVQLEVLAPPSVQVFTVPEERTFFAARCVASGFYPKEIQVEWLQNQVPLPPQNVTSQSGLAPDGTYTVQKVILLEGSKTKMKYICRVKHEALDAPVEQNILWQPKSEGNDNMYPTLPNTPSTEKDCVTQSSRHISIPAVPVDSSSTPGSPESPPESPESPPESPSKSPESPPESPSKSYSVVIGFATFILGFLLGTITIYLYSRKRAQSKAVPAKKTKNALLTEKSQWISEDGSKYQPGELFEETRGIQL